MPLLNTHSETVDRDEFRSAPAFPFRLVSLLEDLVEGAEVWTRIKETTHGVADVSAGFFVGRAPARHVEGRHVGDVGLPFLEDVSVEGKIAHMVCRLQCKS